MWTVTHSQSSILCNGTLYTTLVQEFVVRNDCACGSTIGPTISANTGIRVVDAGMPQLSMHSCREMMGIADLTSGVELFNSFFNNFRSLDNKISKDIEGTTALDGEDLSNNKRKL